MIFALLFLLNIVTAYEFISLNSGFSTIPASGTDLYFSYNYPGSGRTSGLYVTLVPTDAAGNALSTLVTGAASFEDDFSALVPVSTTSGALAIELHPTARALPVTPATLYLRLTLSAPAAVAAVALDAAVAPAAVPATVAHAVDVPTRLALPACFGAGADVAVTLQHAAPEGSGVSTDGVFGGQDVCTWNTDRTVCTVSGEAMHGLGGASSLLALTIAPFTVAPPANSAVSIAPATPLTLPLYTPTKTTWDVRTGCAYVARVQAPAAIDGGVPAEFALATLTPTSDTPFKREGWAQSSPVTYPAPLYTETMLLPLVGEVGAGEYVTVAASAINVVPWVNAQLAETSVEAVLMPAKSFTLIKPSDVVTGQTLTKGESHEYALDTIAAPADHTLCAEARVRLSVDATDQNRGVAMVFDNGSFNPQRPAAPLPVTALAGSKSFCTDENESVKGEWIIKMSNNEQTDVTYELRTGLLARTAFTPDLTAPSVAAEVVSHTTYTYTRIALAHAASSLAGANLRVRAVATAPANQSANHYIFASTRNPLPDMDTAQWKSYREHETDLTITGTELGDAPALYVAFSASLAGHYTLEIDLLSEDFVEMDDGGLRTELVLPGASVRGYFTTDFWAGFQFHATDAFCSVFVPDGDANLTVCVGTSSVFENCRTGSFHSTTYRVPLPKVADVVYYEVTNTGAQPANMVIRCASLEKLTDADSEPETSAGGVHGVVNVAVGRVATVASRDPLPEFAYLEPPSGNHVAATSVRVNVGTESLVIPQDITVDVVMCAGHAATSADNVPNSLCVVGKLTSTKTTLDFDLDSILAGHRESLIISIFPHNFGTSALASVPVRFWRLPSVLMETPAPGRLLSVISSSDLLFRTTLEGGNMLRFVADFTLAPSYSAVVAHPVLCISASKFWPKLNADDCDIFVQFPEDKMFASRLVTTIDNTKNTFTAGSHVTVRIGTHDSDIPARTYNTYLRLSNDVVVNGDIYNGVASFSASSTSKSYAVTVPAGKPVTAVFTPHCDGADKLCSAFPMRVLASQGDSYPDPSTATIVTSYYKGAHVAVLPATASTWVMAVEIDDNAFNANGKARFDYSFITDTDAHRIAEYTGATNTVTRTTNTTTFVHESIGQIAVQACVGGISAIWVSAEDTVGLTNLPTSTYTQKMDVPVEQRYLPNRFIDNGVHAPYTFWAADGAPVYTVGTASPRIAPEAVWDGAATVHASGKSAALTLTFRGRVDAAAVHAAVFAYPAAAVEAGNTQPNVYAACGLARLRPNGPNHDSGILVIDELLNNSKFMTTYDGETTTVKFVDTYRKGYLYSVVLTDALGNEFATSPARPDSHSTPKTVQIVLGVVFGLIGTLTMVAGTYFVLRTRRRKADLHAYENIPDIVAERAGDEIDVV